MTDGSTYYTVAYTPPPQKEKSEPYHRIEVKLNRTDINLSYRRGYYSSPQQHPTSEQGIAALLGALQPGMPPATMLYVMASVQPPKGKQKTVKINYIISPSNVTFSDLPENKKHVVVDCMVVAFDKDGKEVAHASDTLDGAIPQAAYDAVMKQGLPANQEIELKPGILQSAARCDGPRHAADRNGRCAAGDFGSIDREVGLSAKLSVRGQTAIGCAQDGLWQTCSKSPPAQSAEARPNA